MNGREFIRRARSYARKNRLTFRLDSRRGKGSHQIIYISDRITTVQHGEIHVGVLASMLKDLGIDREEF